ncbi:MAG: GAF domain-containing protein, partial [Actinobacteria bacterium]|nr:GAF domain-containing protein [Actinomycetota bacterium]
MSDNNNDLKILSKSLKAISKINQELLSFSSEKKLCQNICNDLVRIKGYKFIWIGLKESRNDNITSISIAGKNKDFIKFIKNSWEKYGFNKYSAQKTFGSNKPFLNKDLTNKERFVPWDKEVAKEGFLSALVLPIKYHNDIIGTLHVYSDTKNYFLKEERSFLKEVAGDIGLGIKSIRDDRKSIKSKIEYKEL